MLKWIIDYIHVNIIIIICNNPTSSARLFIAIKHLNNAIENANKHPSVSAKGILMVMVGQSFIIVLVSQNNLGKGDGGLVSAPNGKM